MKLPKLPSGVSLAKDSSGEREYWVLRLGKRWTGGQPRRRTFKTASEALRAWESEKEKKLERGTGGYELSAAQLAEAQAAFQAAEKLGVTLTQILAHYRRTARPQAGAISYDKAASGALAQAKRERASVDTLRTLSFRWKHFRRWLEANRPRCLSSISLVGLADIRDYVQAGTVSQRTRVHMRDELSTLFRWAKEAGHISENPCRAIKIRVPKKTDPVCILSPSQAEKLLAVCVSGFAGIDATGRPLKVEPLEMLPVVAVGLLAGLRPKEAQRLDWSEIGPEKIDLAAAKTKKSARRLIPLEENLCAWLDLCRQADGPVAPKNLKRKFAALSRAADLSPWPQDCLRHSYASYHFAQYKNVGETMANLGHHDKATFVNHYFEVVKKGEDTKKFWSLAPCKNESSMV